MQFRTGSSAPLFAERVVHLPRFPLLIFVFLFCFVCFHFVRIDSYLNISTNYNNLYQMTKETPFSHAFNSRGFMILLGAAKFCWQRTSVKHV